MRTLLLAACVALAQPTTGTMAVTIDTAVVDARGRSIPTLSGPDFTVELDGQRQRLVAVMYFGSGAPMTGAIGPTFDAVTAAPPIYRLVVQAPEGARAGQEFRVSVKVQHPGATVQAPQRAAAAPMTVIGTRPEGPPPGVPGSVEARLRMAMAAGRTETGLPIAFGYTNRKDADSGQPVLDVQFEVPGPAAPPLKSVVGLVTTRSGAMRTAAPEFQTIDGRYRVDLSVSVEPGQYKVRFAVTDAAGALGAGEYPVTAQLRQFGPISASDLLRWTVDAKGRRPLHVTEVAPEVTTIAAGLELYEAQTAIPPADLIVKIELAGRQNNATPLIERLVTPEVRGRFLAADAEFPLERVGNGEYVLRATVMSGASILGTATAPIVIKR